MKLSLAAWLPSAMLSLPSGRAEQPLRQCLRWPPSFRLPSTHVHSHWRCTRWRIHEWVKGRVWTPSGEISSGGGRSAAVSVWAQVPLDSVAGLKEIGEWGALQIRDKCCPLYRPEVELDSVSVAAVGIVPSVLILCLIFVFVVVVVVFVVLHYMVTIDSKRTWERHGRDWTEGEEEGREGEGTKGKVCEQCSNYGSS